MKVSGRAAIQCRERLALKLERDGHHRPWQPVV